MSKLEERPLIAEIKGLKIDYRNGRSFVHAVQQASIEIAEGQTVGIVGESGSGKSTIARALLGLLDPATACIVAGRIQIEGKDVTVLKPREWERIRGNPAAMVFQDPLTFLNPVMTVGRQIEESIRLHDRKTAPNARVSDLVDMVKLPRGAAKSYPDELSGGMRQRALLAVALGCRPRLLIADEPTTALDVTTQAEMIELLRDVQRQTGMAILLISHDLGLVASLCEKIYVMYAGRTIEWGFQDRVFGSPCHPYTRGLLAAAEGERTKDGYFVTIAGDVPDLREVTGGCPFEPRCSWARRECAVMPEATELGARDMHFVCCHLAHEISLSTGVAT